MKCIVALDSFKGSLDAASACAAVRRGLLQVSPGLNCVVRPMADGGEGTASAIRSARGGEWVSVRVMGPLPSRSVDAGFVWLADEGTAVIEMASASGLTLLAPSERDPLGTTSYGTGELMVAAMLKGAKRLVLAVGGSATVDGGIGAAMALGWQFLDETGVSVGLGGAALERVVEIVPPVQPLSVPVEVWCDVADRLTGASGVAALYGPQKGASPEAVVRLDRGLKHLADRVRAVLQVDMEVLRGGGAAGGLAAGAHVFFGGRLVSGVDAVMAMVGLSEVLDGADWVITGEGCFDASSLRGKVVSGVLRVVRERAVKVGVLAGSVALGPEEWGRAGVDWADEIVSSDVSPEEAMGNAGPLLEAAAVRLARSWPVGD